MASPSTRRTWPLTRARPPPRSSSRRVMTSKVRQPCCARCRPNIAGSGVRAEGVNVVQHEVLQLRALGEQPGKHAVAQQIGHLEPVADRVQALRWEVVGVIAALAGGARPVEERGAEAVAHFLLLLVQPLLRHLLPKKAQVAHHRNHAQTDGPAGRQQQRPGIMVVVLAAQVIPQSRRGSGSWW